MFGLDERIADLAQGGGLAVVLPVALVLGLRRASDPDHPAAVSTDRVRSGGRHAPCRACETAPLTTLRRIDFTLFKALNGLAAGHDSLVEDPLRFCAVNLQYAFAALLALLFFVTGRWRSVKGRHAVVAAGFSALLALGLAHLIADVWTRPRPYVAHPDVHLFIAPSADPSFPSDHATAGFAIAVALFLRHRTAGWIALAMATVMSIARVAVGTHYPADVLAGAAVGTAAALVFWHPSVREPLRRLAELAGDAYERLLARQGAASR